MQRRETILDFQASISQLPLPDQWIKWTTKLQSELNQSQYQAYLQNFNQHFPFNTKYWTKLAYHQLKKGKPQCIKIFQLALCKNPKSICLWKEYFTWLKETIQDADPQFLLADLQRGLEVIGRHPECKLIYDFWFQVAGEKDIGKAYAMKKRMIDTMLCLDEKALQEFVVWLRGLNNQNLLKLGRLPTHWIMLETDYLTILQEKCKILINNLFTNIKSARILSKKYNLGNLAFQFLIQNILRKHGNMEIIHQTYQNTYQRALISNCDNEDLWKQYFEYLQFQLSNTSKILNTFRSIPKFFKNFSIQLVCYWMELQEAENVYQARQLIVEMLKTKPHLHFFNKHLQLEIRAKDFSNAKILYQSMLNVFSNNLQIVSYNLVQYTEFLVKYFRDIELCKRLFKTYFDRYPFSKYLFRGYLDFYLKHVELKVENKDLINQFIEIVKAGIIKAFKEIDEDEYKQVLVWTNHIMRSYLPKIFSLKTAEKVLLETELLLKNEEHQDITKASLNRFEGVETLSKRRKLNQEKQDNKFQTLY